MDEHMSYIGICHCGQVVCAVVDNPARRRDVAREVASWIRDGLTIERVTSAYVRTHIGRCRCGTHENQQERMFD